MHRLFCLSLLVVGLLCAATALAEDKVLINGIDAEFPPYAFVDKDGKAKGFDIDALEWIAQKMNFKVKHQPVEWKGIIPALTSGKIDLIASGMSITAERAKVVNFTKPYKTIQQVLVVKKDNAKGTADLMKGKVGIQTGTTEAKWLEDQIKAGSLKTDLVQYANSPLAIQDVLNGRIEAAAMDDTMAAELIKNQPLKVHGTFGMEPEQYGYAVRQSDKELLEKLNKGLDMLMKDPYWVELGKKWEDKK